MKDFMKTSFGATAKTIEEIPESELEKHGIRNLQ